MKIINLAADVNPDDSVQLLVEVTGGVVVELTIPLDEIWRRSKLFVDCSCLPDTSGPRLEPELR